MGRASPAVAAFVAGEFAPQMEGRVDIEKYPVGAHIAQNFIPLKQGPAMFRQGTAFVQPVKNSANRTWLVKFVYSQTVGNSFQIEFGDQYVRFYSNHGPLLADWFNGWVNTIGYNIGSLVNVSGIIYYAIQASGGTLSPVSPPNAAYWYPMSPYQSSTQVAIYEIPSPYAAADLTDQYGEFTLQVAQQGDVLYIAGGNAGAGYAPYTLTRYSNSPPQWQFTRYAPTDGPFISPVPLVKGSEVAMTVSAAAGNGITITAWNGAPFATTDVGRLVRIASGYFNVTPWTFNVGFITGAQCTANGNNYTAVGGGTTAGSAPLHTAGAVYDGQGGILWLYTDSGYGIAQITAYTSGSQVTANVITQFPANVVWGAAGVAISAITQANPAILTVTATPALTNTPVVPVILVGVAGMTQVNGTQYTATVSSDTSVTLTGINSTNYTAYTVGGVLVLDASVQWQIGSWSNTTEWPRAVGFFKDRLIWAGKLNVWGSVPGNYSSQAQDFFGQQTTDSGMNELVSGADASNVCWLSSAIILLIGTEGGEYGLDAANYSVSPLGPDNVEILRQSQWRCRSIKPELVGVTVLYVQRAGRKVLAADYNLFLDRYDSTDQSKFSYHITIGGITSIAYQQEPFSILWATRADGTLLSYTFNREDNVTAWARHNLVGNGIVESISSIASPDGSRDELWMIVNRTINGVTCRYVEYMVKHFEGPQAGYPGDAQSSAWYLDCAEQSIAAPPTGATTTTVTLSTNPATCQPYLL